MKKTEASQSCDKKAQIHFPYSMLSEFSIRVHNPQFLRFTEFATLIHARIFLLFKFKYLTLFVRTLFFSVIRVANRLVVLLEVSCAIKIAANPHPASGHQNWVWAVSGVKSRD